MYVDTHKYKRKQLLPRDLQSRKNNKEKEYSNNNNKRIKDKNADKNVFMYVKSNIIKICNNDFFLSKRKFLYEKILIRR